MNGGSILGGELGSKGIGKNQSRAWDNQMNVQEEMPVGHCDSTQKVRVGNIFKIGNLQYIRLCWISL